MSASGKFIVAFDASGKMEEVEVQDIRMQIAGKRLSSEYQGNDHLLSISLFALFSLLCQRLKSPHAETCRCESPEAPSGKRKP